MKRFLSMLLTAAMLVTAAPTTFADDIADDNQIVTAAETETENSASGDELNNSEESEDKEEIKNDEESESEDNTEAEAPAEEEKTAEDENNSDDNVVDESIVKSQEDNDNEISLYADETSEVQYSIDGGNNWIESTLVNAVTTIGTGTGTIKVIADITTTSEIVVSGDINLDLCGFTINGNNTHRVFKVTGKLTLDDSSETKTGTIKGGYIKSSSSTASPIGGAAVYLPADTNAVFVMNSGNFLENRAEGELGLGGAILAEPNTTLTINGGSFVSNEAAFAGGAIGVDSAEFLMNGVELSKNKSIEVSGTFYGAYGGGAIFLQITTGSKPKNVPTIKNCIFDSNSTTASQGFGGGAIISNEASLNITGCKFTNNTASAYRGGAIHAYESDVNISDSIISDNEARIGGGIYISNGGTTTVSNSYIVDNKATSAGYDVANNSASAKYTMPTSYTDKSTGKTYGVKWYYDGLKAGETASRYIESAAEEKTDLADTSEKCGLKAVYTEAVDPEVHLKYETYGRYAKTVDKDMTYAEAIEMLKADNPTDPELTVLKSFSVNQPWTYGGKIMKSASLAESPIITRTDDYNGEIISLKSNTLRVSDVVLDGQDKANIESPLIKATGGSIVLTSVVLRNNKNSAVSSKGGAILVDGKATLGFSSGSSDELCENVIIDNCSAVHGGALYFDGSSNAKGIFKNSQFINNTADTGSVLYANEQFNLVFESCLFNGNKYVTSDTNSDNFTKSSTIYCTRTSDKDDHSYTQIFLCGNTSFDGNSTNSDILLDGTLTDLSDGTYFYTTTGNIAGRDGFKNVGNDKIKLAVGAYNRNPASYSFGRVAGLSSGAWAEEAAAFNLVPTLGETLESDVRIAPHDGYFKLEKITAKDIRLLSIEMQGEKRVAAQEMADFASQYSKANIKLEAIEGTLETKSSADTATSTSKYVFKATAKSTSTTIKDMYLAYTEGTEAKVKGTVGSDGQTATLTVTPDDWLKLYDASQGSSSLIAVIYVITETKVTLTVKNINYPEGVTGTSFNAVVDNKTVNPGESITVDAGKAVEFKQTGLDDWLGYIEDETGNNSIILSSGKYSIRQLNKNATINVGFKHKTTVGGEYKDYGTYAIDTEMMAAKTNTSYGSLKKNFQQMTIKPNDNYKLENVTAATKSGQDIKVYFAYINEDGTTDEKVTDYSKIGNYLIGFYMPDDDVIVTPVYKALAQEITIDTVEGGMISAEPNGSVAQGVTVKLTANPNYGYELGSWNVYKTDDTATTVAVTKAEDGTYTFTMPSYPVTVSAVFVKKTHNITTSVASGAESGTVSVSQAENVEVGAEVTVTANASEYYTIDKVIATEKTTGNKITITDNKFAMPDDDVVVTATFKKQQFTVTKAATENGTITIVAPEPGSDGNVTLDWGKTVKINVKADNFYEIATVTVGGSTVDVDINGDYSFEMPKNDTTISATFKKVKYTITGQGDNVTFDIPSSDTYNWGDIVEFTVTPAQWYTIDSVTIPNIEITDKGNGKYSFVMPSRNVTITVIASKPMHTITFDTKGGNAVQSVTVANGDSFEKTIPTWAGRGFAGWYLDENYENKYDFSTPVEKSMTLYARWFLWGDVNGDQEIDSYDAALIRRCMVGLAPYDKMTQRIAGFVTGFADGRSNPDSSDAATIRRLCVGLITRFKVEDEKAGCEFDLDTNSIVNN